MLYQAIVFRHNYNLEEASIIIITTTTTTTTTTTKDRNIDFIFCADYEYYVV